MAQSIRTRLRRLPRQEEEVHVITNPLDREDDRKRRRKVFRNSRESGNIRTRLTDHDYQAPLTSGAIPRDSKWLIVRRNLHRIRFMGYNAQARDNTLPDFYIGLQMKRELKRAQEEIKNIDKEKNFYAIQQFALAVDKKRTKLYDTSHVQPNDALTYDRLGEEPLALQNLLYYFSQQDVPHGTLFWDFLNEVNRVLNMKRKRTVRIERLRKLAFTLSTMFYILVGFMLFLLIISVISTASKMNDPEVQWIEPKIDTFSEKLISSSLTPA